MNDSEAQNAEIDKLLPPSIAATISARSQEAINNNAGSSNSAVKPIRSDNATKTIIINTTSEEIKGEEFKNLSKKGSKNRSTITKDQLGLDEDALKQGPSMRHRFTGIALALLSCMGFSASSLIIKYLRDYDPFTKAVWRFQGLVIPAIPMMIYSRYWNNKPVFDSVYPPCEEGRGTNILFILIRSTAALSSLIIQFYALQYIPLADQMVIGSSQPVFVSIVAYFLLGEACGFVPVFNCILTIIGVAIVVKPPMFTGMESFDKDLLIGAGLALASTAMSVISIIFTRRLKHIHFTIIAFAFGTYSVIVSLSASMALNTFQLPQSENHLLIAILLAFFVFVTQTSTIVALKYEQAGPVSLVKTSSIVFAFIWQYLFLEKIPDAFSLIGAAIIVTAVVLTTLRKWIGTLKLNDPKRKRFGFLLK